MRVYATAGIRFEQGGPGRGHEAHRGGFGHPPARPAPAIPPPPLGAGLPDGRHTPKLSALWRLVLAWILVPSRLTWREPQQLQLAGQLQQLHEQRLQLRKEAPAEGGNGVVVRVGVGGEIPEGHRVVGGPFDLPAGKHAGGIAVEQQRQQHPRMVRLGAATPVGRLQRTQVQVLHRVGHKPRQVVFRKPLLHRRWEQKRRLAIRHDETTAHHSSRVRCTEPASV
jgi:hypothetical protein